MLAFFIEGAYVGQEDIAGFVACIIGFLYLDPFDTSPNCGLASHGLDTTFLNIFGGGVEGSSWGGSNE